MWYVITEKWRTRREKNKSKKTRIEYIEIELTVNTQFVWFPFVFGGLSTVCWQPDKFLPLFQLNRFFLSLSHFLFLFFSLCLSLSYQKINSFATNAYLYFSVQEFMWFFDWIWFDLILLTLYLERNTSWKPVLKLSSNSNMVPCFCLNFTRFHTFFYRNCNLFIFNFFSVSKFCWSKQRFVI